MPDLRFAGVWRFSIRRRRLYRAFGTAKFLLHSRSLRSRFRNFTRKTGYFLCLAGGTLSGRYDRSLGSQQIVDRVKGVVCINAGGGIYLKEEFERFRSVGKQLVKMRPGWLSHLPLADFVFARDSVARSIGRSWGRQRLRDFVAAHPEAALGALLDSTTEAQIHLLPQIVSQLKQPVYFIAGTKDKIMEPKYVLHLASFHWMFQGCGENVLQLPDSGHLAMVEQPDAVA